MKIGTLWLWSVGIAALSLVGCVSPNVKVDKALNALRTGNDAAALAWAENTRNSFYSRDLGHLEAGRVRMLSGDFSGSVGDFAAAIDTVIEQTDEGPRIKLGDVGANVMAGTVTDDRTRPYRLPPYEFIQALVYQMLNRIFLGDYGGAAVEARRAVFAQDQIAAKYGADVRAARSSVAQNGDNEAQALGLQKVEAALASMDGVASLARSSYENPLAWWLCGLVFEQERDLANARLAYQKAHELAPHNPYMQCDWLRVLRSQDPTGYRAELTRAGVGEASLARPETELILIFEQGFVPQRLSQKIPIPVMDAFISIDFPFYQAPAFASAAPTLADGGVAMGTAVSALNMQALAYRDLKEKIPGIVARNISRAMVRVAAAVAAKEVARHNSNGVGSLIQLGVLAGSAVATAINRADTRAWYTLPQAVYVWRGAVGAGQHTIELRNPATGWATSIPIAITPGETQVLWVHDGGGSSPRQASAPLKAP